MLESSPPNHETRDAGTAGAGPLGLLLLDLLRWPLQVFCFGAALLAVFAVASQLGLTGSMLGVVEGASPIAWIGAMIFLVGLGFAGFLWWLAAQSFALLTNPAIAQERLAGMRDLPLALPEGTVRALLALIVGVIGLPLLLFSKTLGLSDAIAGYVNGIVTGVFGFYFGMRGGGADAQMARRAQDQLTARDRAAFQLETENQSLKQGVERQVADAARPLRVAETETRLARHIEAAEMVLTALGPVLPKGLIPDAAPAALAEARKAVVALQGAKMGTVSEGQLNEAAQALARLLGAQPLLPLIRSAASLLPAGTALGPIGAVAAVLGLGWHFGAQEYQRWRARVLAAPFAPQLFDMGLITPSGAELRLETCPIFSRAFAQLKTEPAFMAALLDMVRRDDALDRLWAAHGADPARFPGGRAELAAGLDEFRAALLADIAARDVTAEKIAASLAPLAGRGQLPPGAALPSPEEVNRLVDALGKADATTPESRAAFEALVMLVGHLREKNIDPVTLVAELAP